MSNGDKQRMIDSEFTVIDRVKEVTMDGICVKDEWQQMTKITYLSRKPLEKEKERDQECSKKTIEYIRKDTNLWKCNWEIKKRGKAP